MGRGWRNCAVGALLLIGAGCLPDNFRCNWTTSKPVQKDYTGAQFVTGELDAVAESTVGVLHNLDIEAVAQMSGDRVIVRCTTKKGKKFVLFLERWPQKDGVKTRLDLAWDGIPDEALRFQVLGGIVALYAK
ncbi:hypothetical protein AYO44_01755 [Planctomycetaceae bacterium SCGC AG-212-F19]|nr:hypothetical protein AYO44_01755 [Planctomycetaceae bacterium SCGC AG-212-F19]